MSILLWPLFSDRGLRLPAARKFRTTPFLDTSLRPTPRAFLAPRVTWTGLFFLTTAMPFINVSRNLSLRAKRTPSYRADRLSTAAGLAIS